MTGVRDYSTGELKHNVVALAGPYWYGHQQQCRQKWRGE